MWNFMGDDVVVAVEAGVVASLRAKFEAVLPHLDERQQRLVMAGEARSLGHGGIAAVASASGASRSRVSQGVAELEAGEAPLRRVRREGGGRKALAATDPALIAALLALVEPTRRGDPCSPLCWTTLSTRRVGSTSASSAAISAGSVAASALRPPPSRRTRRNGASPASSSATPCETLERDAPLALATAAIPP